jgi:hypothetical protein
MPIRRYDHDPSELAFASGLLCLFFRLSLILKAQDSPQWRSLNRDGVIPSYKGPQTWPEDFGIRLVR